MVASVLCCGDSQAIHKLATIGPDFHRSLAAGSLAGRSPTAADLPHHPQISVPSSFGALAFARDLLLISCGGKFSLIKCEVCPDQGRTVVGGSPEARPPLHHH